MRGLAFACVLCACTSSAPPNVQASSYDRTCSVASDCVAIQEGSSCCACDNAAINKSDFARYSADDKKRRDACVGNGKACAIDCQAGATTCVAGTCDICRTIPCSADGGTDAKTD